jgi:hypothetical protein
MQEVTFTTTTEEQAAQREKELAAYTAAQSQAITDRDRQANEQAGKEYQARAAREAAEAQQNEAALSARELQSKLTAAEVRVSQLQAAINTPEAREFERELASAEAHLVGRPLREATSNQVQHIVHLRVLAELGSARLDVLKSELANEQVHLKSVRENLSRQTSVYEKAKRLLAKLVS